MAAPPPPAIPAKKKDFNKTPQELVGDFWDKFFTKKPGKVTSIFPRSLYATLLPPLHPRGAYTARNAAESYEAAAKECRERVRRIVRECNRTNEKFTDPDFDIETDDDNNCLNGLIRDDGGAGDSVDDAGTSVSPAALRSSLDTLVASNVLPAGAAVPVDVGAMSNFISSSSFSLSSLFGSAGARGAKSGERDKAGRRQGARALRRGVQAGEWYSPGSKHRVDWIFESPQFTVDGYSSSDIRQGGDGDCWWLAAVTTIAHRKDLMSKVCVARDEECGVYGFVFYRDGEWLSTVIDDNLYLSNEDFDFYGDQYDATGKRAREHRKRYQTGSDALYFAKCADQNETWLPLLEKAYAKIHGDYESISGGWSGEAVEDMTGGVTTTVATNRVMKKDKLWKELVASDGDFVFALSAIGTGWDYKKNGLALGHAYSILKATEEVDEEGRKFRLVQIRNPWGERSWNGVGEWSGPWSDGSREWTPYWLKKLNYSFGDDGVFWMSYQDMLDTFLFLHRTRLFDDKWTVVQQWTSVNIGWVSGYLQTKFLVEIKKGGMVVIVLTQLDERYFVGLEGSYEFSLHFLLQEENGKPGEHICRVRPAHPWENRSVSCEIDLEPGRYEVLPKITATRDDNKKMVEDVVKDAAAKNPQKLRQIGMNYDLAHARGGVPNEDELLEKRKAEEKKKKELEKKKQKDKEAKEAAEAAAAAKKDDGKKDDDKPKDGGATKAEEEKSDSKGDKGDAAKEEQKAEPSDKKDDAEAGDKKADDNSAEKPAESSDPKPESKKEDASAGVSTSAPIDQGPVGDDKKDDDKGDKKDEKDDEEKKDGDDDDAGPPWNAVCVMALRVYAKDPEVTITLVKPKNPEEASSLDVDGQTAAGATM